MVVIFVIKGNVIAKDLGSNITPSKTEIKQSDGAINVTVNFGDFKDLPKGEIYSYMGRLEYDKNIFRDITSNNFKTLNNWDNFVFNPKTNEFIVINKTGVTSGEDVVNLSLNLEDDVKANETTISIKDLTTSDGINDIQISDASVKVNIIEEQSGLPIKTTVNQETVKDEGLQIGGTGVFNVGQSIFNPRNIFIILFIIGLCTALFLLIGPKKSFKLLIKSKTFIIITTIASTVIAVQTIGTIHTLNTQGDLDGNRVLDYNDVSMIQKYLVNLSDLPNDVIRKADVDFDGKLTITDLYIVIKKIEKNTDYKLHMSSELDEFYFEKNADVTYKFNATLDNSAIIDVVVINGEEYKAIQLPNSGEYSTTIKAPNKSGIYNISVTGVRLKTGKRLYVNIVDKIEVLKNAPQILNYEVKNMDVNGKMNISFDVKDNDNALTNSSINILNDGKKSILSKEVKNSNNSVDIVLQSGADYVFSVGLYYNRDSDLLEGKDIDNTSEFLFEKELKFILDYKFKLSNIKTYNNSNVEKVDFDIEEPIILAFNSSNVTKFIPKSIVVNGTPYPVEFKNSRYEVKINKFTDIGRKDIKIEQIVLDNGAIFRTDNSVSVDILKKDKQHSDINISHFGATPNTKENTIDIRFDVNISKNSLKDLTLLILDAKNNIVFEDVVNNGNYDKSIDISNHLDTRYVVKIITNKGNSNEEIVYNKEIEYGPSVSVGNPKFSKTNLEKGENLGITYTLKTNVQSNVKKIIVGNIEVPVLNHGNNIYSTTIQVGQNSGKQEMQLNKVILQNNVEIESNYSQQIEILKSHISIDGYSTSDDINNNKMKFSFNVVDIDSAFISSNAQLIDKNGKLIKEQNIPRIGHNDVVFDVIEKEKYDFKVISTYKRDEDGKNIVSNEILGKSAQLIPNYNLTVSDIGAYDKGIKVSYINRNSTVNIRFTSENKSNFTPTKVTINGNSYNVNNVKSNTYETSINGFLDNGIKNIKIEEITLSNGRKLPVTKNNNISVDVLKLVPVANNFKYQNLSNGNVKANFDIADAENTIIEYRVVVNDGVSNIYTKDNMTGSTQQFEFPSNSSKFYNVKVFANYDLDSNSLDNSSNLYIDNQIMVGKVKFNKELIEFKDITDVELYEKIVNKVKMVDNLDVTTFNPQNYIAKVKMEDMQSLYLKIKSGRAENGKFLLELDYDNVVNYSSSLRSDILTVSYGTINNNIVKKMYMDEILDVISKNPNAIINLTNNIDMKGFKYSGNSTAIPTEFKGVINGNGYTISNLSKPLFNNINGAKINGLIIDNSDISGAQGILSNTASGITVNDVHITNSQLVATHDNGMGALSGTFRGNSTIDESSVLNTNIKGPLRIGGLVGRVYDKLTVNNTVVTGNLTTSNDAVGAFTGDALGDMKINNSYAKVEITSAKDDINGGLIGYIGTKKVIFNNTLSMADGNKGFRIVGKKYTTMTNTYEMSESKLISNVNEGATEISIKDINDNFYKNTLKLDDKIWVINANSNATNTPMLKKYSKYISGVVERPSNGVYIPEVSRLKDLQSYDVNKEIAYSNMYKLMPFYDAGIYVDYGNKIAKDHTLNTLKIRSIVPFGKNGTYIVGLDNNTFNNIDKIKIIFGDNTEETYKVIFTKKMSDVAVYDIPSLNISYIYNKLVLDNNNTLISELVQEATAMDYKTSIGALTTEDESRLYVDFYNETVKPKLQDIVIKILQNQPEYNIYLDSEILNTKIKDELITENKLKEILYAYNYYDKWYGIDLGSARLSDVIFFNVRDMVNSSLDIKTITSQVLQTASSYRNINKTIDFYNNLIKPQANSMTIKAFLESYIKIFSSYTNGEDWFTNNFNGNIKERPIIGKEGIVDYRAWTLMNKRNHILLPILTAPQDDMYIISVPSQILIGSLNRYTAHLNGDNAKMNKDLEYTANTLSNFYNTSAGFIANSGNILNTTTNIQYDSRQGFPNIGTQDKLTTQDPVIKWVYEPINSFAATNGASAYANGKDVYWVVETAISGQRGFRTLSHETAHNQDGSYFYEGNGRRNGSGAEDHSDEVIAQKLHDGTLAFNIRGDMDISASVSTNFKLNRINSKDKIHSYYKEMFKTHYVLDYLTAQAFLKLTPKEQSRLGTQVHYVGATAQNPQTDTTQYKALTEKQFTDMKLKTIDDLYRNKIVLHTAQTIGTNQYGGDTHFNVYWYQPHNNNGRPDSYTFKRLAFEMLGVGGYTNGYVAALSGTSKNDLEALRTATGVPNITWEQYKLGRYKNVEDNLSKATYFDSKKVIDLYVKAFKEDYLNNNNNRAQSDNVRRVLLGIVKRVTDDFTTSTIYDEQDIINITSAQQLVDEMENNSVGHYNIMNDIDFSNINVSGKTAYVMNKFYGVIDGNGYKMIGTKIPLLLNVEYSQLRNFTFEPKEFSNMDKSILIVNAKNIILEDIMVKNVNIMLPLIENENGNIINSGNVEINMASIPISTVNDIIAINNDITGLASKKPYVLKNDIDVSSFNSSKSIFTKEFNGIIDGAGFKLTNGSRALFVKVNNAYIHNLKLDGFNITNNSAKSILAENMVESRINDVHIVNSNLHSNNTSGTGAFVGSMTNQSTIESSSITNTTIKGAKRVGGFIGQSGGANNLIKNSYIQGEIIHSQDAVGGIIGQGAEIHIRDCYTDVKFKSTSSSPASGILGYSWQNEHVNIKNILAVNEGDRGSRVVKNGWAQLENVFEISESNLSSNVAFGATEISKTDINDDFFINRLGFDTSVWDISNTSSTNMPTLKNNK